MPRRVGIDLVCIDEVASAISRHADRYLARVCTPAERAQCGTSPRIRTRRVAERVAAKEAVLKLLRPAAGAAVPFAAVEVLAGPGGTVDVALSGQAAELARRAGIGRIAASLACENGHAVAVATGEIGPIARHGVV